MLTLFKDYCEGATAIMDFWGDFTILSMPIVQASIQRRASVLGININSGALEMDVEIIVISPCGGKNGRRPHVVDMPLSPCPLG